ncbi:uncharacterized protein MYCGRDRAFT_109107 [Zymoseptoria tritici IPO323]|uniref:Dynein regulatory complex protein 1/2 N-terminal domain-containing protein n=2 Tax=Zymoseptoria tritici TaxID=1047171 RepID=F9XA62_ZYMTI|nr:uncharacterized protein MYCGRDRAFT_109107 [Zymoseptoria tritici IPO323]EGP87960.1 hypothetical protein MYCGRDRAFT_109107 [Zymoseptoria tritici IPO323]
MLYTRDPKDKPLVLLKSAWKAAEQEPFEKLLKTTKGDVDVQEGMSRLDLTPETSRSADARSEQMEFYLGAKAKEADQMMQEIGVVLKEKDEELLYSETKLVEKDKQLSEKETKLAEKDKQLSDSQKKLAAVEMQYRECLTECEEIVDVCDQDRAECERLLGEKDEMVRGLQAELDQARSGKGGVENAS